MSNPKHIDGQTAKSFFKAATESAFKQKILSISAYSARRGPAPWWSKGVRDYWQSEVRSYPDIAAAKTDADEYLVACANKRRTTGDPNFQAISVRPVWFNHNPGSGKAQGGKTKVGVTVSPDNVAHVAIMLLGRKDTRGNFDVAGEGVLSIADAIDQAVEQSITSLDEEDIVRNNALVL
ncbi:hypothetical protein BC832DRAFT_569602 [Gaertneriomyces semiglobifer]|nr:hypothetical protein BC832DRAFT_569602 [Gaertneriomyces semiglobifer]